MKIGIVQMPMAWTLEKNVNVICSTITKHAALDVLVFPELAITGFHRKIPRESCPDRISQALTQIKKHCRQSKTLAFIGYPIIDHGKIYNGYAAIDEHGMIAATWRKVGLTESEATFFEPGVGRDVFAHTFGRFSTFICREASDYDWFIEEVSVHQPEYIIWPGYVSQPEVVPLQVGEDYDEGASKIALTLKAVVVQCNWPQSLNKAGEENLGLGGSKIFGPTGEVLCQLPLDQPCLAVFDTESLALCSVEHFKVDSEVLAVDVG
ncbi:carbon-nitrogen hydrolase family protein [Photobacterium sp. MCCC 1A19761]|uniref:carbon-nitrogen hydrolase family protein n=1 Tax=Photobacterium sp. MCCC 1A19761 TaxID=3115000 RepID=UPI00307F0492